MLTAVTIIHLLLALLIITFVLLQDAKGGGAFGMGAPSGSQSLFGSTGAASFLVKTTTWLGILFAVTCVVLSYMTVDHGTSVIDNYIPGAAQTAPAAAAPAPEQAPEATQPPSK